jgi:diguanylate cyclase (GGDEF)-like protein
VGLFFDITQSKLQKDELELLAHYDPLTKLPNRTLLGDHFKLAVATTKSEGSLVAICYFDLDGFKAVNDSFGHQVGDRLLVQVAQRIKSALRDCDTVSRFGGDEFIILLNNLISVEQSKLVIARVHDDLSKPYFLDHNKITISASSGITFYPSDNADLDVLLRHADQAMYRAKLEGRNHFRMFDSVYNDKIQKEKLQIKRISEALKNKEFCLYYQPKVNMRNAEIVGFEALIRWQHPELGILGPMEFLPLADSTDLIFDIGQWVIEDALNQMQEWMNLGKTYPVAVNISPRHFVSPNFVTWLRSTLAKYPRVPRQFLELEILESSAIEDIDQVTSIINTCHDMGVTFALDDFGTGYSSLSYLKALPINTIKIDRTFIRDMLDDSGDLAVIEGIVKLASVFKRKVVAEGVELSDQGVLLMRLGCDVAQGFGIAKPMPANFVLDWIDKFNLDNSWTKWADVKWKLSDLPLIVVQYDHQRWVKQIILALDGAELSLNETELIDFRESRFGRWYYGEGKKKYSKLKAFNELEKMQLEAHQIGPKILRLKQEGSLVEAQVAAKELLVLKDLIVEKISDLQHQYIEKLN